MNNLQSAESENYASYGKNVLDKNGWIRRKAYLQTKQGMIYEATLDIANGRDRQDSKGNYIIASFDLKNNLNGEIAHKATSIYGRESLPNLLKSLGEDASVFVNNKKELDHMLRGNQIYRSLELRAKVKFNDTVPQDSGNVKKKFSISQHSLNVLSEDLRQAFERMPEDRKSLLTVVIFFTLIRI